ncbi:MAG: hypothetical protein R3C12_15370 [Planctomycetaceae bacterium]|nr:hypothetical protein [Planctomycetaceae bacterium]
MRNRFALSLIVILLTVASIMTSTMGKEARAALAKSKVEVGSSAQESIEENSPSDNISDAMFGATVECHAGRGRAALEHYPSGTYRTASLHHFTRGPPVTV